MTGCHSSNHLWAMHGSKTIINTHISNIAVAYSQIKQASTNLNDQLYFSTSGNGPPRASSSSLDESGGAGDQGVVDESLVEHVSPQPCPGTSRELDDTPKPKAKHSK